ncbi:hypothetical protein [Tardiphaga sp. 862_B3_N1_1]
MHRYAQHTKPSDIAPTLSERCSGFALAFIIAFTLAMALVNWWSS